MAKSKKKRDKKYRGAGAKNTENSVKILKVSAKNRSDFAQWVFERRKMLRNIGIAVLIVGAIIFLIVNAILASS